MGDKNKIKHLKKQVKDLEAERARAQRYLLWGALVVIGIAILATGDTTPSGRW